MSKFAAPTIESHSGEGPSGMLSRDCAAGFFVESKSKVILFSKA